MTRAQLDEVLAWYRRRLDATYRACVETADLEHLASSEEERSAIRDLAAAVCVEYEAAIRGAAKRIAAKLQAEAERREKASRDLN